MKEDVISFPNLELCGGEMECAWRFRKWIYQAY